VEILFETPRLYIRHARPDEADTAFFLRLWNDPQVMRNVGFPFGLRLDAVQVRRALERDLQQGEGRHLDACLVAVRRDTDQVVGECRLGTPDAQGLSETDVKLLPEFWGRGYGTELKRGLLAYLFTHTECLLVQATPNVDNRASIRMQEAVGGRRVGETTHEFPPEMRSFTCPVRCYIYQVRKDDWLNDNPTGAPR
jgi:RimJ/RimL family protein N-acetyltransferase